MNIFEFAMKMEEDGRTYYLEHARKIENPALKKILLDMADDELKHFKIFQAMRNQETIEYLDSSKTTIIDTVKNAFEELKQEAKEHTTQTDFRKIWETALEIEEKAENFYREKAEEIDDSNGKRTLRKIADEEHNHWIAIENVIQFLDKPKQWLENSEWSDLETF